MEAERVKIIETPSSNRIGLRASARNAAFESRRSHLLKRVKAFIIKQARKLVGLDTVDKFQNPENPSAILFELEDRTFNLISHYKEGDITETGKALIIGHLESWALPIPGDDFEWVLKTGRGKFTKRYISYLKRSGVKKDFKNFESIIGMWADMYAHKSIGSCKVTFLKAKPGTEKYGNVNSCWSNGYVRNFEAIHHGYAIVLYTGRRLTIKNSVGRAFAVQIQKDLFLIFNSYYNGNGQASRLFAEHLASFLKKSFQPCSVAAEFGLSIMGDGALIGTKRALDNFLTTNHLKLPGKKVLNFTMKVGTRKVYKQF